MTLHTDNYSNYNSNNHSGQPFYVELKLSSVTQDTMFTTESTISLTTANDSSFLNSSANSSISGYGDVNLEHMYYPVLKQPTHLVVMYTIAYSIVFLLGILGNSLVVCVVYRNPRMHNVTNYFIVNLAIADILVCILCLPITLMSNLYTGKFNQFNYVYFIL